MSLAQEVKDLVEDKVWVVYSFTEAIEFLPFDLTDLGYEEGKDFMLDEGELHITRDLTLTNSVRSLLRKNNATRVTQYGG